MAWSVFHGERGYNSPARKLFTRLTCFCAVSLLLHFLLPCPASAAPSIGGVPSSLDFSGEAYSSISSQNITITNTGDAVLNYTVSSDMFWLSVSNSNGSLAPGVSTSCTARVDTRGLASRDYSAHLIVNDPAASNTPQTAGINLQIKSVTPPSLIKCWGDNTYQQTNMPPNLTNAIAMDCGYDHSLALLPNGSITVWGDNSRGQTNVPPGLTNAVAIAAGGLHSLALLPGGSVIAWGDSSMSQTNVPATLTNAVAIAGGMYNSMALRSDGSVVVWGDNTHGQTNVPPGLTNAVAIAGGGYHAMALRSDGSVIAWGSDVYGQTNVPASLTNAVAISCGANHSMALRSDGSVTAWGNDTFGQSSAQPGLTDVVAIAGGEYHSMAILAGGTCAAWGDNSHNQGNVPPDFTNAAAIAGGMYHTAVLMPASELLVSSPNGAPLPAVGTNWVIRNARHECAANPDIQGATQHVCVGWTGSGSVPSSGTSNSFSAFFSTNSTLTWNWTTNYWLSLTSGPEGAATPTNGWYAKDSIVNCQAFPTNFCSFDSWTGTCVSTDNPLLLPMDGSHQLTASYIAEVATNGVPKWWLDYYGWSSNFDSAAMTDDDSDGARTWQEYWADTDPTVSGSVLRITSVIQQTGTVTITWTGGSNACQLIEQSTDLSPTGPGWTCIFTNLPPTSVTTNYHLTATNQPGYYRIRIAPNP